MTDHTCTKHQPGAPACYKSHGCRCAPCRRESNRAKKRSACGLSDLVDAAPARAHIEALTAAGITPSSIAQASGTYPTHIVYIRTTAKRIHRDISARIIAARIPTTNGRVDGAGTRRRLQALAVAGWDGATLAARLGSAGRQVSWLRNRDRVHARSAARVAALYDELWDKAGPSNLSRLRATRRGWLPSLAWDEGHGPHGIDNPNATPHDCARGPERRTTTAAQRIEAIEAGATLADLVAQGQTPKAIERSLQRAGRADLWLHVRPRRQDNRDPWKDAA